MTDCEKRILSESLKRGEELTRENRKLKEESALWHNLFNELLAYHFAEGGSAPNLRFERITDTNEPENDPYEFIDNVDHLTIIQVEVRR